MKKAKTLLFFGLMGIGIVLSMSSCQRIAQKFGELTEKATNADSTQVENDEAVTIGDGPVTVNTRTYKGESFFKAKIARKLYADQAWSIQWPVSAVNCDLKKFQKELLTFFVGDEYDSIDSFINKLNNEFCGEDEWVKVPEMGETDSDTDCEDGYNPYPQSMYYGLEQVSLEGNDIITFSKSVIYDAGSGTGAGVFIIKEFLMYDLNAGKRLTYDDIFKSGSEDAIARLLKTNAINLDEYSTLMDAYFPPVHKDNFYVNYSKREASFVYGKYEVAAGADGVVILTIPFDDIMEYMK